MAAIIPELTQLSSPNHELTKTPTKSNTRASNPLSLLPKCTSLKELKQIQAYSMKTHLHNDTSWVTKLINSCTVDPTPSSMNHARQLFDQMPHPDIILFNFMARGYARTYTPLEAIRLFVTVVSLGLVPDHYTFPSLLKACANAKALQEGKQLHCLAIKHGLNHSIYIYPALINMYTECDNMGSARFVFNRIKEPCPVTYNSIITSYVRTNQPYEALLMFQEMQTKRVKPTDVTMLSILSACALLGALNTGKWVHEYIKTNGFDQYVKVNTALLDMYSKCGSLENAISVFKNTSFRDTQTWSAMIMAYALHGQGQKAVSLFEKMKKEQVKPDEITFLGLLHACNHSGLVDESLTYFHNMKGKYGISPGIKHYGCVLDALARSGRLDDAYNFISKIPTKPTLILWRSLLAACSRHKNIKLGKQVLSKIFSLDPSHGGDYVIFSNMCARAGKHDDAIYTRKLMKTRGVVKEPGCSVIEVNHRVYQFFSGDGTWVSHLDLHQAVDELFNKLKLVGYEPDTGLVVHSSMEDDEKEVSLRYHSEKLAIVFGLLNTRPGETIRVVKNIRICTDCHSACKFISSFCGREILVRDVHRFHRFVGGRCSCDDYW